MMKLLIVEDNAAMRRLLRSLVQTMASEIYECSDGAEAVATYAAQQFSGDDCVLMDIELPRLNGLAATTQIKAAHPQARILIVTAHDSAELRAASRQAGACAYVLKSDLRALWPLLAA